LGSIVATDFSFGVVIPTLSHYTCIEFCVTPTCSLGGTSTWVNYV